VKSAVCSALVTTAVGRPLAGAAYCLETKAPMASSAWLPCGIGPAGAVYCDQVFRKFVGVNPVRRRNADEK